MLTSCSGDGPPKITPTSKASRLRSTRRPDRRPGWGSRVVVWEVVLVQHGVAGREVLADPSDRLLPSSYAQHAGPPSAAEQGGPVGPPHHHQVEPPLDHGLGEPPVLLVLAGPQLDHARRDHHPAAGARARLEQLEGGARPG